MKKVFMIFSDPIITRFMQDADMFEPFKVKIQPVMEATVVDDFGPKHIDRIKEICEIERQCLVACVGSEVYYVDPTVKVVSTGTHWTPIEDFLKTLV